MVGCDPSPGKARPIGSLLMPTHLRPHQMPFPDIVSQSSGYVAVAAMTPISGDDAVA